MVHDHGIGAANALHERIGEGRRAKEGRRQTNRPSGGIDNAGAAKINGWPILRYSSENGERPLKLVPLPDVILIGKGVVVRLGSLADCRQEIDDSSLAGAVDQNNLVLAMSRRAELLHHRARFVRRAVVADIKA